MIGLAKDAEVRLILTLTDSQGDYGGMSQYVRWNMPLAETIKDFYTSRTIRVRCKIVRLHPFLLARFARACLQRHNLTAAYRDWDPLLAVADLERALIAVPALRSSLSHAERLAAKLDKWQHCLT